MQLSKFNKIRKPPTSGAPAEKSVEKLRKIILENRQNTKERLADELVTQEGSAYIILSYRLGATKMTAKCLP